MRGRLICKCFQWIEPSWSNGSGTSYPDIRGLHWACSLASLVQGEALGTLNHIIIVIHWDFGKVWISPEAFLWHIISLVGLWSKTSFWHDCRCIDIPLRSLYPRVTKPLAMVRQFLGIIGDAIAWSGYAWWALTSLCSLLPNPSLSPHEDDTLIWRWERRDDFLVRTMYCYLISGGGDLPLLIYILSSS